MADTIFSYENVKNNKEIRDQWRNYILQKFSDKASWPLLTQILGDSSTLQIDKLTPESFDKINKIFGAPAIYEDRPIDTTPLRPPLMQKDFVPAVEPATQNDKTDKPVVVTGGQPSNGNPSKKTTGWSSDKGLMRKDGNGTLASAGVAKGGTKTIGFDDPYDPNPGNVSLAYTMRNAPEQERRDALINAWNKEHGRESVPYIPGTKIPAGSLNRSSSTYASPSVSSGGTYATGEGIKDANGNVLTNPGGNADYQYALRDPSYGLVVRDRLTDAQKNYLQAVAHDMGYNYDR